MSNAGYYRENRRRSRIADEEWEVRQPYGAFTVSAEVGAWADEVAGDSAASLLPLGLSTVAEWGLALGINDGQPPLSLGQLLNAIAAGAQRDGVLTAPEPGIVAVAWAGRRRDTEQEAALGWGFKPGAARYLVIHARAALALDAVADGPGGAGAAAVAGVVRAAADRLSDCRPGPVDSMLRQLPLIVGPTSRTPGR